MTIVVIEHGHSLVISPHFDGNNYAYWKVRMKIFLKSIDERVWKFVEYGWEKPTTLVSEWETSKKKAAASNSKAMNAIFNAVSMEYLRESLMLRLLILLGISSKLCMKAQRLSKSINCSN